MERKLFSSLEKDGKEDIGLQDTIYPTLQEKWSLTTLLMVINDALKRRYFSLRRFEKRRQSVAYVRVETNSADAF